MRILHTSDWHIGKRLKEHERYNEFKDFFQWLKEKIISENIDVLLVAGDIFDNTTPSTQAQEIYYSFLAGLHYIDVIIISGNHDSPAFIDAPAEILKRCNIHVIGSAFNNENISQEIITLESPNGEKKLIVCAVPYLRDKDVRTVNPNDNFQDIEKALHDGIKNHYEKIFDLAKNLRGDLNIPIIAMGHLFVNGGKSQPDDGTRSLYVGTLGKVPADIFPDFITYTALGHLHSPQKIFRDNIRYSGSPIAMGFGEAGQEKSVCIIETEGRFLKSIKEIPVPAFQKLERISGNLEEITEKIEKLSAEAGEEENSVWLEITHTGEDLPAALQERLNAYTQNNKNIEILSVNDENRIKTIDTGEFNGQSLEEFSPQKIFEQRLKAGNIPEEKQKIFIKMHNEILEQAHENIRD